MGVPYVGSHGWVPLKGVHLRGSLVEVTWRPSPGGGPLEGSPFVVAWWGSVDEDAEWGNSAAGHL